MRTKSGRYPEEDVHLLVVDDEKSICDIVGQYLRMKGYAVPARVGGRGRRLHKAEQPSTLFSLISRCPACRASTCSSGCASTTIRCRCSSPPGIPTLDTAIEALKLGAFDYLTKPFHLEEIAEKIKRALINKQLEEENLLFSNSFPCTR